MHTFGPLDLNLSPKLVIKDLIIQSNQSVIQFFGKNGSGKSTVLELIRQQLHASGKNFSYLNQDYRSNWLWWKTAYQNLELSFHIGNTNHSSAQKEQNAATSFVDSDLYHRHKSWLKPMLESNQKSVFFEKNPEMATVDLSGGQLQRMIVLRELLHNPDYFLLDEAFSALDSDITADIITMLKHEQSLRPFVIISIAHSIQVKELLQGDIFEFDVDPASKMLSVTKQ